jgi:hypothetical protein
LKTTGIFDLESMSAPELDLINFGKTAASKFQRKVLLEFATIGCTRSRVRSGMKTIAIIDLASSMSAAKLDLASFEMDLDYA